VFKILNMKNFLSFLTLIISFSSIGQQKLELFEVDQNKLLKDIVYTHTGNDDITILYWFPEIYWEVMAAKDPKSITPEVISQLKQMLGNKSIFIAVSGKMNTSTRSFQAKEESYIRSNISVVLNGKAYKPIADSKLSEELKMLNSYLKPMFAQMLGEMGSGMSIFYFEITDNSGENLLNPYNNLDFNLNLASVKNTFHLPLPSLFQDSKCTNDGELFPANYEFCPYHGSKLITQ
jgi:hypothetical protein